jgi:uroporphyrinogen-III synthase
MNPTPPRVLVTRPAGQAGELSALLREAGCDPVEVPAIAIRPCQDWTVLDGVLTRLATYDWLLVTSRNAVDVLFARLSILGQRVPRSLRFAAIGPGTAAALTMRAVATPWVPSAFTSRALAEEIPITPGQRVLRLRAEVAAEIGIGLRARGALVDEVVAYRTIEAPPESVPLLQGAFAGGVDAVVLASASAAHGFVALAGAAGIGSRLHEVPIVAIGPVTAEAASAAGLRVEMVAGEHSLAGIMDLIVRRVSDGVRHVHPT